MKTYRICENHAPHCEPWWSVEELKRGWFGERWKVVARVVGATPMGLIRSRSFKTKEAAQAWIDSAKIERRHICGEAQ